MEFVIGWDFVCSKNYKSYGTKRRHTKKWLNALNGARQVAQSQADGQPYDEPIAVLFEFHEPDRRHRDIWNYVELLGDALEDIAYTDDWHVNLSVEVRREVDRENPRVEITILPIDSIDIILNSCGEPQ